MSYRNLTQEERYQIAALLRAGFSNVAIARKLGRHPSTIGRADGFRLAGEQEAQRVRKAQHPLPHRARAEHFFHQMPRGFGHAPRAATGAEAASLATERDEALGVAVFAHHTYEAAFEHAATQIRIELLSHMHRRYAAFARRARGRAPARKGACVQERGVRGAAMRTPRAMAGQCATWQRAVFAAVSAHGIGVRRNVGWEISH